VLRRYCYEKLFNKLFNGDRASSVGNIFDQVVHLISALDQVFADILLCLKVILRINKHRYQTHDPGQWRADDVQLHPGDRLQFFILLGFLASLQTKEI
jgi:hypothetical protein